MRKKKRKNEEEEVTFMRRPRCAISLPTKYCLHPKTMKRSNNDREKRKMHLSLSTATKNGVVHRRARGR
tara:strand:- start:3843 stop:4049 length:207 start_codon:yes stop_codon:yes gene_type:complete